MLQDSADLAEALDKVGGQESANDLIASFVNYRHPLLTPAFVTALNIDATNDRIVNGWRHTSYLGYLSLLLALFALVKAQDRRKLLPWLSLFCVFFVLRLGSELRINDVIYSNVLLPKYYLDKLFPPVFQAFHETDHFQIGLLLPLAILASVGLRTALLRVAPKYHVPIILLAGAILCFESYYQPFSRTVTEEQIAFNYWLKTEPDQDAIRLINLPIGRSPSKFYSYYQTNQRLSTCGRSCHAYAVIVLLVHSRQHVAPPLVTLAHGAGMFH